MFKCGVEQIKKVNYMTHLNMKARNTHLLNGLTHLDRSQALPFLKSSQTLIVKDKYNQMQK